MNNTSKISHLRNLCAYIDKFSQSEMADVMRTTVEDSPWHREANVWVHTEMVVQQYIDRFSADRSVNDIVVSVLALLFHDTGKPEAEETLEKKDGTGVYRRYASHEQVSAVVFTEEWLKDADLQMLVSPWNARKIRFIIEHHLPYGLKDAKKVQDLATAVDRTCGFKAFFDCLRSDAAGRISDDHEQKLQNVEDWIEKFADVPVTVSSEVKHPICFIMIGASGSGKSTWLKDRGCEQDAVVSLDAYRLAFFTARGGVADSQKGEYTAAWDYCNANQKDFDAFVNSQVKQAFGDASYNKTDVYIDNMNVSKKSRARWVQEARNKDMHVVAVEFWVPLEVVKARQKTRDDKEVPDYAVAQAHRSQTCALLGSECDSVMLVFYRTT